MWLEREFQCALSSLWIILTVTATLIVVYFAWRKIMSPYSYFSERGIAFQKPAPIFGNVARMMLYRESLLEAIVRPYNEFRHKKFYGVYEFSRPLLAIRDPELIRQITVTDFDHFVDHPTYFANTANEPLLSKPLMMLRGQRWRQMRATLTPAFTGSKMRHMFGLVLGCCEQSVTALRTEAAQTSERPFVLDMKDMCTRFTNDVIASTAFGIDVNSLADRQNEFYVLGKSLFSVSVMKMVRVMVLVVFPSLARVLGLRIFERRLSTFYHSLVHDTIRERKEKGITRPDMIQLLMAAREGALKPDDIISTGATEERMESSTSERRHDELKNKEEKPGSTFVWDDDDVTAQSFLFFLAGFESSATVLCFAAHELMENPSIQQRLIEELDAAKYMLAGKPLTYDILQQLEYLDMVVSETLRKWPPSGPVDRQCNKTFRLIDECGHIVTLQKGDCIMLPVLGIHRDPEYYPDPARFDPERFSAERKSEIHPFTYLPFGAGPRNCIGSRFALMECKAFLYHLLANFTFEVAPTSTVPLVLAKKPFIMEPVKGFNIHLKPRL